MNTRFILIAALVGALIIAVLAAIFALQNPDPTFIRLFTWQFNAPLALVLFVTLGLGVIVGLLVVVPSVVRREMKLRQKNKRIHELESSLEEAQETLGKTQKRTKYLEENMELPNDDSSFA
jgi:putative membrane protein